jgi:integrase
MSNLLQTETTLAVDRYVAFKRAEGARATYCQDVSICLNRFFADCAFVTLSDVTEDRLTKWFIDASRNDEATGRAKRSTRTRRKYRQAVGAFFEWLIKSKLVSWSTNPIHGTPRASSKKRDVRKKRRAMAERELHSLLLMARWRPLAEYGRKIEPRDGNRRCNWAKIAVTLDNLEVFASEARSRLASNPDYLDKLRRIGIERELIYRTLVTTGLRRNELASITACQVITDDGFPRIVLNSDDEKNSEGSTIPIPSDLATDLAAWIDSQRIPPTKAIFRVPRQLVKILDRDLAACGIVKVDARGRSLDVHALRHTHASRLCAAGVSPKVAQQAMRHATIAMTMDVYSHVTDASVRGAIESLPSLTSSAIKVEQPTQATPGLSPEESMVLAAYRRLDPEKRTQVVALLVG